MAVPWLLLLLLVAPSLALADENATLAPCTECAHRKLMEENRQLTEEYRQARIEFIKAQILKKLRLKAPPQVRLSRSSLPSVLSDGELLPKDPEEQSRRRNGDDYYGALKKAFIFPENVSYECHPRRHHPSSCFFFRLPPEVSSRTVVGAKLWLFKLRTAFNSSNYTFVVTELSVNSEYNHIRKGFITSEPKSIKSGWVDVNLGHLVTQWAMRKHSSHGLEISCKGCGHLSESAVSTDIGKQPFIVIHSDPSKVYSRGRRSANCENNTSLCCRQSFFVSFKEIGWDSWIIEPRGYMANFCKGSCKYDTSATRYHHSSVIQSYLQRNPNSTSSLSLCCTPSKMSSIGLIYLQDTDVIQKVLPSMVVEACDCA